LHTNPPTHTQIHSSGTRPSDSLAGKLTAMEAVRNAGQVSKQASHATHHVTVATVHALHVVCWWFARPSLPVIHTTVHSKNQHVATTLWLDGCWPSAPTVTLLCRTLCDLCSCSGQPCCSLLQLECVLCALPHACSFSIFDLFVFSYASLPEEPPQAAQPICACGCVLLMRDAWPFLRACLCTSWPDRSPWHLCREMI
jgi:hypothetical protein